MEEISEAHITNFKGLKSIDLGFGKINIVTGKNNSGKTSLLEAIKITHNPNTIKKYNDNLSNLISVSADATEMTFKRKDEHSNVELRHPGEERVVDILFEVTDIIFDIDKADAQYRRRHILSAEDLDSKSLFQDISSAIEEVIESISPERVSAVQEDILEFEINGEKYTYVNIEAWIELLIHDLSSDIMENIKNNSPELFNTLHNNDMYNDLEATKRLLHSLSGPRTRGIFLGDPPSAGNIQYVEDVILENEPRNRSTDEDNSAIKKVEVRNYLREKGILGNLEDFDFDELVFDEEGEKHSIPYDFMGDGLKTMVGVVWRFVGDDELSDVMLLEEPENNMHPGYVNELVDFLIDVVIDEEIQIFITTHNVDFIMQFFSDELGSNRREFLQKEFKLIQMSELVPKQFDYDQAESQVEDLHNDLRGI